MKGADVTTSTWMKDELGKIAAAEELELASLRRDGALRKPVTIWVVRHGDDLYVRSAYGPTARWYRGVQERHEGRVRAGGVEKHVCFVAAADSVNDAIDAAYRTKYRQYADTYLPPMLTPDVRPTTVKLVPLAPDGTRKK